MLPLDSVPKLAAESPTWSSGLPGDLAVGGNFLCCLIIVFIFIGSGGEILKLSYGRGQVQRDWTTFMLGVRLLRDHVKILIRQLEEG